ncbi:hypothetical protein V8B97DRAFT_2024104 [Scleroderma yunnanense]
MLSPLRDLGIGSSSNHCIVLKRPFISDDPTEVGLPFTHYVLKDETNIPYHEVNALYWAKALLQMTYRFIDHGIKDTRVPPLFKIPHLHFVDTGLLFACLDMSLPDSMVSVVYLAEEFVKYIHNGNAAPCILMDLKVEEIYIKTGGQIYISGYKGSGSLLTDLQILTHP